MKLQYNFLYFLNIAQEFMLKKIIPRKETSNQQKHRRLVIEWQND